MKVGTQVVLRYSYKMKKKTGTIGVLMELKDKEAKIKWLDTKRTQNISRSRIEKATGEDLKKFLEILKNK